MFSDTYPLKLVNDVLYEVTGKVILTIIILARSNEIYYPRIVLRT